MGGEHVQLGLDGRLLADNEETGERLRGLTGRYRLLPTGPDFVVLARDPASGGASTPPRVALVGDVASMPLAEIVEFLHQGRKSGTLRMITATGERAIVLGDGFIRGAFSDEPTDSLPEICMRLGLVDRPKVDLALAARPPSGRFGRALVDAGAISSHDLFKAVQHQVGEIVYAMLVAREGTFVLVDEPIEDRAIPGVQLNAQGLLMDAIRRIDEMAQFRSRLPSGQLYIARRKAAGPALDEEELRAHALCDGTRTLLEIARELRIGEFDATKIVYHLLQGGYVQASPTPAPVADGGKRTDPADVARVFEIIFREAVAAVAHHGDAGPFLLSANGALQTEANRSSFLKGVNLARDGSFDRSALLRNLGAAGLDNAQGQSRALFSALSEVMFFLLFQAGEVLAPAEDDALARRVKDLLATVEPH